MASEIDHRPQEPDTGSASTTKAAKDGATQPLSPPTTNGKPTTTTNTESITNNEGSPAPPIQPTNLLVPLFADGTSSPSASEAEADAGADSDSTTSRAISPITSPPYWQLSHANGSHRPGNNSHNRTPSAESVLPPGAITLQDNEDVSSDAGGGGGRRGDVSGRDRNRACWAKSVEVVNHVVVNGSATNIGAFVVWNIRVETLSGSFMNIRKRYSEFDDFRRRLVQTFPGFEAAVPVLPPKSVISKFRPRFLEKRRAGLQYFLNCIMLNPEFSGSPVLKDFLFS
ncbi:Phox homologous domain-containing protein [Coniochaeta sp. 2T2.1]|nr:Phox homologous domain-containing protein [Coniochaeta sp. 2T2.1]